MVINRDAVYGSIGDSQHGIELWVRLKTPSTLDGDATHAREVLFAVWDFIGVLSPKVIAAV